METAKPSTNKPKHVYTRNMAQEKPFMDSIYFEAQTGIIREQPGRSNFHQYQLSPTDRPVIEAAVGKAVLGNGGLEYQDGFLRSLTDMEWKHRQELNRASRRW